MNPKPGYKLIKLLNRSYQQIPEDWKTEKLGNLSEFGNQGVNTSIDTRGGVT